MRRMMASDLHSPRAHGAGRYFDALGALVLALPVSRYEGDIAAALEAVAAADERRG